MVSEKKVLEANRKKWAALVPVHLKSRYYSVDKFKAGKSSLSNLDLAEVGKVRGKSLLHLQCHFGMDTLSWARLGALVTGVDFSLEAIRAAQALSRELGIPARFVCADIYDLPRRLKGDYDIVYTSHGVLCWLPDLARWGRVVAKYLRPGGAFHLIESHPFTQLLDSEGSRPALNTNRRYFNDGRPTHYKDDFTYADGKIPRPMDVYVWPFSLSGVINALTAAGLRVEYVREFPFCDWGFSSWVSKSRDGNWYPRGNDIELPLTFSLRATKPS
ncbi:MAG: class I SAM-dependent methyltransferase [Thermoplasmata archaeon]